MIEKLRKHKENYQKDIDENSRLTKEFTDKKGFRDCDYLKAKQQQAVYLRGAWNALNNLELELIGGVE